MGRFILNMPPVHRADPTLDAWKLIASVFSDKPIVFIHHNQAHAEAVTAEVRRILEVTP